MSRAPLLLDTNVLLQSARRRELGSHITVQVTYLLFVKMACEKTLPPRGRPSVVLPNCDWPSLLVRGGEGLETRCRHVRGTLGKEV
jgi:hypothetical protein